MQAFKRLRCIGRRWWTTISTLGRTKWDGHCWMGTNEDPVDCIDCGKIDS